MHGQGSYNPQFRQTPQTPVPPPYQQHPPGPPPPQTHFQRGPPGPANYQHGPPAPPHQTHQVPPARMPSTGQSYSHPSLPIHGSPSLPHMFLTAQQSAQHPSALGTQNTHHMPPRIPPPLGTSRPEGLQAPPPPALSQSQGQTFYRAPVQPPHHHIPPHQHPSHLSSFCSTGPTVSISTGGDPRAPVPGLLPPPPPHSSSPHSLPAPPPLTSMLSSSKTGLVASNLCCNSDSAPSSYDLSCSNLRASDSADGLVALNHVRRNLLADDGSKLDEGENGLCLMPSGNDPSKESYHSHADSDMEMEDDITQVDHEESVNHSLEGLNFERKMLPSELDAKEKLCGLQSASECDQDGDNLFEKAPISGCSGLGKQGPAGVPICSQASFGRSASKVNNLVINPSGAADQSLATNLKKCTTSCAGDVHSSVPLAAAGCIDSEEQSSQLVKVSSPFRLLEDYASDDSSENDAKTYLESVGQLEGSSFVAAGSKNLKREIGFNLEKDGRNNDLCKTEKGFGPCSELSRSYKVREILPGSEEFKGTNKNSIMCENEYLVQQRNQATNNASSLENSQREDAMVGTCVAVGSDGKFGKDKTEEKNAKFASTQCKVDKFGRLVREGASESDSDDSHYSGRHIRRGRSQSQSRSPLDRRRRRSPRRGREKRSQSRSWSPRNRWSRSPRTRRKRSRSPRARRSRSRSPRARRSRSRSPRTRRSRSPTFRRVAEFSVENMRREKGQIPDCFDFRRGRCYRGASCRFMHNDSDKSDESWRKRSKRQYMEGRHSSRGDIHEDIKRISQKVSLEGHAEFKGLVMQTDSQFGARRDGNTDLKREDSVYCQSVDYHTIKSTECRDIPAFGTQISENKAGEPSAVTNENYEEAMGSYHSSLVTGFPSKSVRDIDALQSEHTPNRLSPLSKGTGASHKTHPQTASSTFQSSSDEGFSPYMLPNPQSYFTKQLNSSSTSLPPPPRVLLHHSAVNAATSVSGFPTQSWQSDLPQRGDFVAQTILRPRPTEPHHSQVDGFQQQPYPPIQEPNRTLIGISLPVVLPSQKLGGPSLSVENCLSHLPMQCFTASSFTAHGNHHPHSMPSVQELPSSKKQHFPGDRLPPCRPSNSSSNSHPCSQKQQPSFNLPHNLADSAYTLPEKISPSSKYPLDFTDTNQPSGHHESGGSTAPTCHNRHASNFEQPVTSKFSSDVLRQEKDTTYSKTPFSLSHVPFDGRVAVSQEATCSPDSARAVRQNFPISGSDQYDPLLDSIEPSSKFSRKLDNVEKWEAIGDSEVMISGSNKPLYVEENNKMKEVAAVASATSVDNEEYGESADVEAGAVESGNPNNPIDVTNTAAGEIEIDQKKSPGKSRKSRDSRSMKLFKVALADFVKEVLKPSWQQGNMSKEAFKTIVKKTVDKVSGAMKGHHIPKSRVKIDHYIDSSQRKLTKLVMGYVDKYVKV